MLRSKIAKVAVLLSGAAAVILVGGCSTQTPAGKSVSYIDQKGRVRTTSATMRPYRPTAPYALTGQKPVRRVRQYNDKEHPYYVPQ